MKAKFLALAAVAVMTATQANATAFLITYNGTSATTGAFSGSLTGNETGGTITTIGGMSNGLTVTGLSPYAGATQHLSFSSPYTDFGGISFSTSTGSDYNIYLDSSGLFELSSVLDPSGGPSGDAPLSSFTVTAVPEPATWLMMFAGFFMVGFGLRTRKRSVASVACA